MLYALCFVVCLATLATRLEPHQWSWTNALFGGIATHVLIGHLYASKAIDACCFQPQTPRYFGRKSCVYACAKLVMVELLGAVFFGVFGTAFGVLLQRILITRGSRPDQAVSS